MSISILTNVQRVIIATPGPQGPPGPAGGGGGGGGGSGTVTSVVASGGTTGFTFTGGPVTTSGTLTMTGTLSVASGGTGAVTGSAARTALGVGTSDKPEFAGVRMTFGGSTWSLEITGVTSDGTPIMDLIRQ